MRNNLRSLMPLIILFAVLSGLIVVFASALQSAGFNVNVLIYANIILVTISLLSYFMQAKSLKNSNPNVFIRSVMGGMILKMFICVVAVFIYVSAAGKDYSKRSVFVALFLYLIYLAVEVGVVTKMNKKKNA